MNVVNSTNSSSNSGSGSVDQNFDMPRLLPLGVCEKKVQQISPRLSGESFSLDPWREGYKTWWEIGVDKKATWLINKSTESIWVAVSNLIAFWQQS